MPGVSPQRPSGPGATLERNLERGVTPGAPPTPYGAQAKPPVPNQTKTHQPPTTPPPPEAPRRPRQRRTHGGLAVGRSAAVSSVR
ncbi:protein of unknown function [Streptantibioticus cattleyicolor NRRL 8057 = DSM 46488]|nr:protein of unknown function [Streptantibioticus cattleyicolor NRRL 8057 = DSM 46488]